MFFKFVVYPNKILTSADWAAKCDSVTIDNESLIHDPFWQKLSALDRNNTTLIYNHPHIRQIPCKRIGRSFKTSRIFSQALTSVYCSGIILINSVSLRKSRYHIMAHTEYFCYLFNQTWLVLFVMEGLGRGCLEGDVKCRIHHSRGMWGRTLTYFGLKTNEINKKFNFYMSYKRKPKLYASAEWSENPKPKCIFY